MTHKNIFTEQFYERLIQPYNPELSYSGIDGVRIAERLAQLASIGLTDENGSNRMGFSEAEKEAKQLVKKWMVNAGLTVTEDGAGNVFGRLQGTNMNAPTVMSGSHVDSVPNGGHFDGPLGVILALEIVEAWKSNGIFPTKSYEVVIFTDEEGARFNSGLTGSAAFTGDLDKEHLLTIKDVFGQPFEQVVESYGLNSDDLFNSYREMSTIHAFVEVHIEQGKRLEKHNIPVGIVSGIAGPCWLEISFVGAAGHAGNTPMCDRQDALVATSHFIALLEHLPSKISETAVATVGRLHVYPNGANVIPGKVTFTVDIRDIHEATRDQLVEETVSLAQKIAAERYIKLEVTEKTRITPLPIGKEMQHILTKAVESEQIKPYVLPSGAGHDTMMVGKYVPAAMLFVRSQDGISHNPREWSSLNDCTIAAHVLKKAIEQLVK